VIPARLVLATANPGKAEDLRAAVAEWGPLDVRSLGEFPGVACPEETDTSYVENAVAKARAVAVAIGLPALGDDSGLEVDALGSAPGIRSARWAPSDAERIERLLAALRDVPEPARGARFRCVVALAWPDGRVETAEGACTGRIAVARSGSGGFGYDPVFLSDDLGTTFAAAPDADKRRVSHRGRALRALGDRLRQTQDCSPVRDHVR